MDLKKFLYLLTSNSNKNLAVSILLSIIFICLNFIILNETDSIYYFIPGLLAILTLRIAWDQMSQILSSIFIFLIVLLTIKFMRYSMLFKNQQDTQILYNMLQLNSKIEILDKQASRSFNGKLNGSFNIFFIETNEARDAFSSKQLCSIESAAVNNPYANVFVLSIKATNVKNVESFFASLYPNVKFMKFTPLELFYNTPLWDWWYNSKVFLSPYSKAHISDAARLALLYKYGGIYSDLDTITVRSFKPLIKSSGFGYLTEDGGPSLGNGLIIFQSGHPFLNYVMKKFAQNYNPYEWGTNGPVLIRNSLISYCNLNNLTSLIIFNKYSENQNLPSTYSNSKCDNLVLYPESYFYPYNYLDEMQILFKRNTQLDIKKLNQTYSIHFYGSLSDSYKIRANDNSMFEQLAWSNCINTYDHVMQTIGWF